MRHHATTITSFALCWQDSLKLTVFLEFLTGNYVMSLPAELVFIPFISFLAMLNAYAKFNDEHAQVAKATGFLLMVAGFAVIAFAVWGAIKDFQNLETWSTARAISFPPLMSIAFIPFVYCVVTIIAYESILCWVSFGRDKPPEVVRYARRQIFSYCRLSLRRLRD